MLVTAPPHARHAGRRPRGFTLVEVVVVVLLLGVAVAFVAVKLGSDDREALRDEAARLATGLGQAQDEAVMTGATLAWRWAAEGYEFLRRSADGGWAPLDREDAFPARRVAPPVRLVDVEVGGVKITKGALVVLSPSALTGPVRIVLEANSERAAIEVGADTRVVLGGGA
jgi:general secretion pathway protein H